MVLGFLPGLESSDGELAGGVALLWLPVCVGADAISVRDVDVRSVMSAFLIN